MQALLPTVDVIEFGLKEENMEMVWDAVALRWGSTKSATHITANSGWLSNYMDSTKPITMHLNASSFFILTRVCPEQK